MHPIKRIKRNGAVHPCIDISDNPGSRAAARRNAGLCKLLLGTSHVFIKHGLTPRPPYIPCPQEMIRGMNTVGLYFSTVTRFSCSQNTRMKRVTIMSLFNQWSIDTFLAFHVCYARFSLFFREITIFPFFSKK